jgi:hypothetical protein
LGEDIQKGSELLDGAVKCAVPDIAAKEDEGEELPDILERDAASQRKLYMKDLEHRITENLGRRAKITATPRKKVLELAYDDDEDLESLLKSICGAGFFQE